MEPPRTPPETYERVRRRRVLYVYGFDPAAPDRYRRLLARAGRAEAVGPVEAVASGFDGWTVRADGVETQVEVLGYEDVVRAFQRRPAPRRLAAGFASWARFVASGGFRRARRLARGPARLFFYPFVQFASFLLIGLGLGWAAGLSGVWLALAGAALGYGLSLLAERTVFAHLMLGLFEFMEAMAEDRPPAAEMEARIAALAGRIAAASAEDVDEVLVVGHSLGGWAAVRALADASPRLGGAPVGLLTLGSIAGFIAVRKGPGAARYRQAVGAVAADRRVWWVDVSAPRDWFSFGLVDPLLMLEAPPEGARSPRVISAKFGRFRADPEDWRTRFQPMGLHMKYLSAPDLKGGFDPFATFFGDQSLRTRYEWRRDSPKARMWAG